VSGYIGYVFKNTYMALSLAYSHVVDGCVTAGKIVQRKCPAEMIIYVPIDTKIRKAYIILRKPHNHPMHPPTKPTAEDKEMLVEAIDAAGKTGLTVRKLLNGRRLLHMLYRHYVLILRFTSTINLNDIQREISCRNQSSIYGSTSYS
jgi:hypothetical protein